MTANWLRPSVSIPELNSVPECESVLENTLVVLFKHSPTCPVSWMAHREVTRFFSAQPDIPTYLVSVRRRRDVARHIADKTGVMHESPQVLIFRGGTIAGVASHDEITADWLESVALGAESQPGTADSLAVSGPLSDAETVSS
jgi:bacillithiol system protein YtxJ